MFRALMCVALLWVSPVVAASPREAPKAKGLSTHVLTLSLVMAAPSDLDPVNTTPPPANVAKAIQDIKDFLPYAHYELEDTVVLRTAALNPLLAELGGPDARYTANFQYQMTDEPGRLNVHRFQLVRRAGSPPPDPRTGAAADSKAEPPPAREVISTAFSVKVGETIVVGTSRPARPWGTALVLVLTVLPGQ